MNLKQLLMRVQPRRAAGWPDDQDDALVAGLRELAGRDAGDLAARVARNRAVLAARFADAAADGSAPPAPRGFRRLALAPVLATALLLVALTAGAVVASEPGRPLYGIRLAAEELFLPASGPERVTAELDRLDRRVDEAVRAASAGDAGAAAAALRAYEQIAEALMAGTRPDAAERATVAERMRAQMQRLERLHLADDAAEPGSALRAANRALLWLGGGGDPQPPAPTPGSAEPAPTQSPHPSGNGTASPSGTPSPSAGSPGPKSSATPGASGGPGGSRSPSPSGSARVSATPSGSGPPVSAGPGGGQGGA